MELERSVELFGRDVRKLNSNLENMEKDGILAQLTPEKINEFRNHLSMSEIEELASRLIEFL